MHNKAVLAPILLFAYKRPEHTFATLKALSDNFLSDKSELYVFCDGPKSDADKAAISEVIDVVKRFDGFSNVTLIAREVNFGLARSIIEGVDFVCNNHDRFIVLEDDIVTSKFFLKYMNDALDLYRNDMKVMHVSGHMYPIDTQGLSDTFFLNLGTCWGWGAWSRSWSKFKKDCVALENNFSRNMKADFNLDHAFDFWSQIESNRKGLIDTWAVFWYASIYLNKGVSLHPRESLTHNIGFDGSGSNCFDSEQFNVLLASRPVPVERINDIEVCQLGRLRVKQFFLMNKPSFFIKLTSKLKRIFMGKSSSSAR